jgi:large subunit ribosomal protein L6
VALNGADLTVARADDSNENRAKHGMVRALLANMVKGVTDGFERKLEINGVGYRADVSGQKLNMALGFSHPVVFELPKGIGAKVDKNVVILSGIDKEMLGETASKIRAIRPPEPYKGKGIKYVEETIKRKVGKTGAA